MKKSILILLCSLLLAGCQKNPSDDSKIIAEQPVINLTPSPLSDESSVSSNSNIDQSNADAGKSSTITSKNADGRTVYQPGFSYEPLNDDIKERITGISYHENPDITYDELRYVKGIVSEW